jgi:two-component system response regulator NreC
LPANRYLISVSAFPASPRTAFKPMIRVFITDDHEMYLEGLALLLGKQPGIEVIGTSQTGTGLLLDLKNQQPDILLLDVHLPDIDEEELIKKIRASFPALKIIYLTILRGTRYIHKLTKYNTQGYMLKNAPLKELLEAIHTVQDGGTYFSKDVNIHDKKDDFRSTITIEDKNITEILSRRELEVLRLICREFSNAEIAKKLFLSISTVETHRKNLIAKLGVNNTVGLVKFAIAHKLTD